MAKLILLRHGVSVWNEQNLFTGWVDVPLSCKGIEEALAAGDLLSSTPIDVIFISSLIRSQMTAMLAMSRHQSGKVPRIIHPAGGQLQKWGEIFDAEAENKTIPTYVAQELNERMYGKLQGLNKEKTRLKFGEEQVKLWRRSYEISPPDGESLKKTAERTLPYFHASILPLIKGGKHVLVSAHGNSLRSILMELKNLSKEEVVNLEVPTGVPLVYEWTSEGWQKA